MNGSLVHALSWPHFAGRVGSLIGWIHHGLLVHALWPLCRTRGSPIEAGKLVCVIPAMAYCSARLWCADPPACVMMIRLQAPSHACMPQSMRLTLPPWPRACSKVRHITFNNKRQHLSIDHDTEMPGRLRCRFSTFCLSVCQRSTEPRDSQTAFPFTSRHDAGLLVCCVNEKETWNKRSVPPPDTTDRHTIVCWCKSIHANQSVQSIPTAIDAHTHTENTTASSSERPLPLKAQRLHYNTHMPSH